MLAQVGELERVDDQAHVGAVLAGARGGRHVDELDAQLVEARLRLRKRVQSQYARRKMTFPFSSSGSSAGCRSKAPGRCRCW